MIAQLGTDGGLHQRLKVLRLCDRTIKFAKAEHVGGVSQHALIQEAHDWRWRTSCVHHILWWEGRSPAGDQRLTDSKSNLASSLKPLDELTAAVSRHAWIVWLFVDSSGVLWQS